MHDGMVLADVPIGSYDTDSKWHVRAAAGSVSPHEDLVPTRIVDMKFVGTDNFDITKAPTVGSAVIRHNDKEFPEDFTITDNGAEGTSLAKHMSLNLNKNQSRGKLVMSSPPIRMFDDSEPIKGISFSFQTNNTENQAKFGMAFSPWSKDSNYSLPFYTPVVFIWWSEN